MFFAAMLGANTAGAARAADARHQLAAAVIASLDRRSSAISVCWPGSPICSCCTTARTATFNDPNVLGAFLILPAMLALQRVLTGRFADAARACACCSC